MLHKVILLSFDLMVAVVGVTTSLDNNISSMTEIFRYDYWGPFWRNTWYGFNGDGYTMDVFFDYNDQPIMQKYDISDDMTSHNQGMLQLSAQYSENNSFKSIVQGCATVGDSYFGFQYGEIEWKAKVLRSNNVLNIFQIGQFYSHNYDKTSYRELLEDSAVQLAVSQGGKTPAFIRADVFYRPAVLLESWADYESPDCSGSTFSDWISSSFNEGDLSESFHNYKLRWTETELVWFINEKEIFRLNKTLKIPRKKIPIVMRLVTGPNFTAEDEGQLLIESVVVRQNQTAPSRIKRGNYTVIFSNDFAAGKELNLTRWYPVTLEYHTAKGSSVWFDWDQVRSNHGVLQILISRSVNRLNETSYIMGNVVTQEAVQILYGEVEWKMKVANTVPGVFYMFGIQQNMCKEGEFHGEMCYESNALYIIFGYYHNGQVNCWNSYINPTNSSNTLDNYDEFESYNGFIKNKTTKEFHVYRILWTKEYLVWYIDDIEVKRVTDVTQIPDRFSYGLVMKAKTLKYPEPQWPTAELNQSISSIIVMEFKYVEVRKIMEVRGIDNILLPQSVIATIAGVVTFAVIVILLAISAFLLKLKKLRATSSSMNKEAGNDSGKDVSRILALLGTARVGNVKFDSLILQYTRLMEVPRDKVQISEEILGQGEFGIVFKGQAQTLPFISKGPIVVAVKIITNSNEVERQGKFAEELRIMTKLGRHVNVINLLGIVLQESSLLLLEYCEHGSLQSYLRKIGPKNVYVHIDENGYLLPFIENDMKNQWLKNCQTEGQEGAVESGINKCVLTTGDLVRFGHQISRGMEYLVSRHVIHRDLAARNVLVTVDRILKISDFGLAKHGQMSYMSSNVLAALPVLWMSPEAILTGIFTYKSDVWSFGVLLWEIFSLGQNPFDLPDVPKYSASSFAAWLAGGYQMERPHGAPSQIYDIMRHCWNLNPDYRPSFAQLKRQLDQLISGSLGSPDNINYLTLKDSSRVDFTEEYAEILEMLAEIDVND